VKLVGVASRRNWNWTKVVNRNADGLGGRSRTAPAPEQVLSPIA
jgi:hypothetical protein